MRVRQPPVRQAAILCGGLGTRLGPLTRSTPKPLLPVGGRPFLEILIEEVARQRVDRFLLLSAFQSKQITDFAAGVAARLDMRIQVDVSVEPDLAGTGGALWHARDSLDDRFYLLNGDSLFDAPIAGLSRMAAQPSVVGALLLRQMPADPRYGVVDLEVDTIAKFESKHQRTGDVEVNAGVYCFRKTLFEWMSPKCSLENDVLPQLAAAGLLRGIPRKGAFIDIGIPADYERAPAYVAELRRRSAVFINLADFAANPSSAPGLPDIVRAANDGGAYVFASLGPSYASSGDEPALPNGLAEQLEDASASIDDIRSGDDDTAMLSQLIGRWPVKPEASLLIGFDAALSDRTGIRGAPFPELGKADDARDWLREHGVPPR